MARKPKTSATSKGVPASVKDYIERIGASEINFRSYQVKEFKGKYYFEKAYIKINADGSVTAPLDYMPNEKEAEAIKKDWVDGNLPKSCPARNTNGIRLLNAQSKLYLFYNTDGLIIFVQERTEPKGYLPWSFWDDGVWRQMQPEGKIPFYKPRNPKDGAPIMVHEGAKAAQAAQLLPKDHPWYPELSKYEHWGIVGGALAVNRADYDDLRARKSDDTIYVCDNDHPGVSMLPWLSKNYGARLKGAIFDKSFAPSWDIADPLPEHFYNDDRLYIGPKFALFLQPATYATEIIQPTEKGEKPYIVLKRHFAEEWYNVVSPEAFIHRDVASKILTRKEFDNQVAPFSQAKETSNYLVKDLGGKGYAISYHPGKDPGIHTGREGGSYINTYKPPFIEPAEKITKKDIAPFIEFMEHLIEVPGDREETYKWIATLIAKPAVKMHYGLLLVSETQGVGKGTLGEKILAKLVGLDNTSFPGEDEIVDSEYNYWIAHKRLAVVHEIYAGHSSRAYNRLKSLITDQNIMVKKKYMADYHVENFLHAFACSNSMKALKIAQDDRRWLVPKVREEKRSEEYWDIFHTWLRAERGLEKIFRWALDYGKYVKPGQDAPKTEAKTDMVREQYSDGMKLVAHVLEHLREAHPKDDFIIADIDLCDIITHGVYEGKRNDRLEKPITLRGVAKQLDWFISKDRCEVATTAEWKRVRFERPRLICTSKADAERKPIDLAKDGRQLFNIIKYYKEVFAKEQEM
jgi:hypothetical protein